MRPFSLLVLLLSPVALLTTAGCDPCSHDAGVLCALAGTGNTGFNGDGQKALETDFYQVSAARIGPDGLVYVMDFNNHRLRRITSGGTVETVVGNGNHDYAIDGAGVHDTPLENPDEFAFAPDGSLHLVMLHDPRVLRVSDDAVHAIAGDGSQGDTGDGGPAHFAEFTQLVGIAFGADGSLYVSDELTNRVRKIRPDGMIVPFAGTGEAGFSGDGGDATKAQLKEPRGLAVDSNGDVFIADAGNHVIRRVDANGVITTVAGVGGELAADGDGGPATKAHLARPRGMVIAKDGTLYIADTENDRVRRVTPDGVISTIAGTGKRGSDGLDGPGTSAQLGAPSSVSLSPDEKTLLISELGNSRVTQLFLGAGSR